MLSGRDAVGGAACGDYAEGVVRCAQALELPELQEEKKKTAKQSDMERWLCWELMPGISWKPRLVYLSETTGRAAAFKTGEASS